MDSICSRQPHFKPNKERMIRMTKFKKALITTAALATAALCSLTAYAAVHIVWVDTYQDGVVVSSVGMAADSIKGEQVSKTVGNMTTYYTHTTAATASTQVLVMNAVNNSSETKYMSGFVSVCDEGKNIIWSHYRANSGNVSAHTPLVASYSFNNSSLSSGYYYLAYQSSIFKSNNSHAPVAYSSRLDEPFTID